jgi:hypothetical protein
MLSSELLIGQYRACSYNQCSNQIIHLIQSSFMKSFDNYKSPTCFSSGATFSWSIFLCFRGEWHPYAETCRSVTLVMNFTLLSTFVC